ncbi:DnaJ-class molecular chaperone [Streptomyces eurocidicus]|uniref:DnaJ-class molecular chaperone n=1 Tax=Streptomyces eurocidicus TaxID=66423 RepID=A0A7W8EZ72_STREU|nr:DnaJ-class molecular chaperone [Streptomyces eurocidicus]
MSLPPEKDCPDCGGSGHATWESHEGDEVTTECSGCAGTGTVLA